MVQLPCWLSRKFISHRDNRVPCINANQCTHAIITHLASMSTDAHVSLELASITYPFAWYSGNTIRTHTAPPGQNLFTCQG
ncbi:hypothetical protein QL285_070831 [Trifolium repens]|nr:hypothetical protein QL285_070831 [Trifolium repens]